MTLQLNPMRDNKVKGISSMTAGDLPPLPWIKVINPAARLGKVRHALFDFDGTISVIRRGWEKVMVPMMVEMICGKHQSCIKIQSEVELFVDRSTGILTIKQMQWLVQMVQKYGITTNVLTAYEYKRLYNERLLQPVRQRMQALDGSQTARDKLMVCGVFLFLNEIKSRGVQLYLASGTDHHYVLEEANVLGIDTYFKPHIYGAMDTQPDLTKANIIEKIMRDNNLVGDELGVFGDGPVEIHYAKANGALAIGVAAEEESRQGFDMRKVQRLQEAGADLIISEYINYQELANYLCGKDT